MKKILNNYLPRDLVLEVEKFVGPGKNDIVGCQNENCKYKDIFNYITNRNNFSFYCDITKTKIFCDKCIKINRCLKCDEMKKLKKNLTPLELLF